MAQARLGVVLGGVRLRPRVMLLERAIPRAEVICLAGHVATAVEYERAGVRPLHADPEERATLQRTLRLLEAARGRGALILGPRDVVAYRDYPSTRAYVSAPPWELQPGWRPGDVGQQTLQSFTDALGAVDTVVWSGPLGTAGEHPFARGSIALARLLSRDGRGSAPRLVVAGRETVEVVSAAGVEVVAASSAAEWWRNSRRAGSVASGEQEGRPTSAE